MSNYKIGDTIKCDTVGEMICVMYDLQKEKIETDFMFNKDGQEGMWLEVKKVGGN